jgi:hypothetical protein
MKLFKAFLVMVFATTVAGTAWSQGADTGPSPGTIPGYLDLRTNSFRPIHVHPVASPASVSASTGTIITTFAITVASTIPAATQITCNVTASVIEINSSFEVTNNIVDSATVLASRNVAAGSATCTVKIPYSWLLLTPSGDQANLSYDINANTALAKTTKADTLINRNSTQTFDIISIPGDNGATTNESVQATI